MILLNIYTYLAALFFSLIDDLKKKHLLNIQLQGFNYFSARERITILKISHVYAGAV